MKKITLLLTCAALTATIACSKKNDDAKSSGTAQGVAFEKDGTTCTKEAVKDVNDTTSALNRDAKNVQDQKALKLTPAQRSQLYPKSRAACDSFKAKWPNGVPTCDIIAPKTGETTSGGSGVIESTCHDLFGIPVRAAKAKPGVVDTEELGADDDSAS